MTTLTFHPVSIGLSRNLPAGIDGIWRFFSLFANAMKARRTWERLNAMSDAQLARHGLVRQDIIVAVRDRLSPDPQ